MTRVPAIKITIERVEGMAHECVAKTAHTWAAANQILREWSTTAPKNGGYDKCDFTIIFENGQQYTGRYDLMHWERAEPSLEGHVAAFIGYCAGIRRPAWMNDDQWRQACRDNDKDGTTEAYLNFAQKYEIPGLEP
jgi:hypothetical protein